MSSSPHSLEYAVYKTVAYADIFDYALRPEEICKYLIGRSARLPEIKQRLGHPSWLDHYVDQKADYYFLRGRSWLVDKRIEREQRAKRLWSKVERYAGMLDRVPFVKCVAVTGGLSMNNAPPDCDIDLFIVTHQGQLWRSRLLIQSFKRWVELTEGVQLCPNYILSEDSLRFPDHNVYTAHELAQMVPLTGLSVYRKILTQNRWIYDYLPNVTPNINSPYFVHERSHDHWIRQTGEFLLKILPEPSLRKWQINRLIRNNNEQFLENDEVKLSKDCYKGHADAHGQRVLRAFDKRIQQLDLETTLPAS